MLSLLCIAAISGTATVKSLSIHTRSRQKKRGKQRVSRLPQKNRKPLAKFENQVHHYLEDKIDRILGDQRKQQLQQLNTGVEIEISEASKKDNRRLVGTGLNASASLLLGAISPVLVVLTVPTSLYFLHHHFHDAWVTWRTKRRIDVNAVDSAATIVAIATGFLRAMSVSMFLFSILSKLRNKAKQQSEQRLTGLFTQTPTSVWVLRDAAEIEIPLKHLQPSDTLVVHSGQVIPVDGMIINGQGLVDQSLLTGESQPAEKKTDDEVFACTLLLGGSLQIKINHSGQDTVAARIGEILEKTANHKDRHEFVAEQFANRAATPTLLLSALALPLAGPSGAIGVLWSCFGYSMRISSPISIMKYLSYASDQQILIKDGMAMETLADIDTIVFDKTGTLTEEKPVISTIHSFSAQSEDTILSYAASAEHRQSHPIAHSIIDAAKRRQLPIPDSEDSHCQLGYGVTAVIDGQITHVGSPRFLEQSGIVVSAHAQQICREAEANGHSVVMLAINNTLSGAIELQPLIRPATDTLIQFLKQQGIQTCIISGDREIPTQKLCQELAIDQYFANTLPDQKASIIQELQEQGRKVCFIGDGLNDAIALKQADLSVSLKGATTAATDTASIVLMDANLLHLATLVQMGTAFNKNQQSNLRISIVPAAASVAGVFFFHTGLALAAAMFYLSMGLGIKNANQTIQLPRLPAPHDSKNNNAK